MSECQTFMGVGSVVINDVEYVPKHTIEPKGGEVVTILQVRPIYGLKFSNLMLKFAMPGQRFSPGDKVRIINETKRIEL